MGSKIQDFFDDYNKKHGKGSVSFFSDYGDSSVECITTGSLKFDLMLGGNKIFKGFPRGRIIEIYGAEASFKTTITLLTIAAAQKRGETCAFIDVEHAFDSDMAKRLGVNIDTLILSQPDCAEDTFELIEGLASTGEVSVIGVDSVAAMTPKAELEGEFGESKMGVHARLMSQGMRKLKGIVSKTKTTLIFINQIRMKIGVMYGSPETTTGGEALKYYASLRVRSASSNMVEKDSFGTELGKILKPKVIKSKIAPPVKGQEIDFYYEGGLDKNAEILDLAVGAEIVKRGGSWFSYGDTKLGQGKSNVLELLEDNPELAEELEQKVRQHFTPDVEV
jgi:recombination protein RecA